MVVPSFATQVPTAASLVGLALVDPSLVTRASTVASLADLVASVLFVAFPYQVMVAVSISYFAYLNLS